MDSIITDEDRLQEAIARYPNDPYGFVMYAYPWGEEGTDLAKETGPDEWQTQILKDIGHGLTHGYVVNNGVKIDCKSGIFIAVASGHGIGKSALMSMLDQWFISTRKNPQIVTTANTKDQLTSKTWREESKWHKMLINGHWFEWTATKFACKADPETWFSAVIPWNENKPEAFAGTHEKNVLLKYDEASAIPPPIWETSEGAMTEADGVKIWIAFGNPTQNTGRFYECFNKDRGRWITYQINARTSKRTDNSLFDVWDKLYGDDSDFCRVRIKGMFPRSGAKQFIGNDLVEAAMGKVLHPSTFMDRPKILGVDIARFGDDKTVLVMRQGLAVYGMKKYRELDSVRCAGVIATAIKDHDPDAVFMDMGNTGSAVYDFLVAWGYEDRITGVKFGDSADDSKVYFNKRVEMWGRCKDALKRGLALPYDTELRDDLIGPEYMFSAKEQFQLESKDDMRKRGIDSPDCGDAVVLTWAYPVAERRKPHKGHEGIKDKAVTDYDMMGDKQPEAPKAVVDYNLMV